MEELDLSLQETKEFFVQAFKENMIVPILGSGFTRGLKTKRGGMVPSGADLKQEMINKLVLKQKVDRDELGKEQFSSVSELFQNTFQNPSEEGIIEYYVTNYIGVKLDRPQQKRFLNEIEWPYIYTLNIDTGIEDSDLGRWEVFYPNRKFDERIVDEGCKRLYKIHGDVAMFCKSLDYDEMILTESQYIASLEKNEQFHDLLSSDCGNKNLVYIGCSLDDEIDIKYSVLSDKNRNKKVRDIRGIYVTADNLTALKKTKLEGFNISHIVQLSSVEDYELFYEFLVQCYIESKKSDERNIDQYRYHEMEVLENDKDLNLDYLADLSPNKNKLPFYYVPSERIEKVNLLTNRINVIIGRRFVGKSLLAYSLLEANPNYQRYYISEKETLLEKDVIELLKLKGAFIVFDTGSLDDRGFINLLNNFDETKKNIVCVFLNSFDDVTNLISFKSELINYALDSNMKGEILQADASSINEKLDLLGIAKFNIKSNLLDNTLRIANVYNRKIIDKYTITSIDELKLIIWLLIKNRIYFEELVTLGISRNYKDIVAKFSPFIQEEHCKRGEIGEHSSVKVICNGKLGLLQILNSYIYPSSKSGLGNNILKTHQENVCEALYRILFSYSRIGMDNVKEFLQFDKLNDVFSRIYSKSSISYMETGGKVGKRRYGAASIIQAVYADEKIKQLKADDPNYWLQRAKSIYITNYRHPGSCTELMEAIDWAKKAEQDSRTKVENGEGKYSRTESNAIMQIAMLYGKLARIKRYSDEKINESALEYYFKGFSDMNNISAATTLLNNSRGTEDFSQFVSRLVDKNDCVGADWRREKDYLVNIKISQQI